MNQAKSMDDVLQQTGLSLPELILLIKDGLTTSSLFRLSDQDHAEYHRLFTLFVQSRNGDNKDKGEALENLASFLLSKLGVYRVARNQKTSTNEMDVVLVKDLTLSVFGGDLFPPYVICECKNYASSVSVTYVGKFYSLLKVSGVKLGLIISNEKISGRSKWEAGKGLCRKVALRDDTWIINISYDDLKAIDEKNISLLQLIRDKISDIKLDTTISYTEHVLCQDAAFIEMPSP